MNSRKRVQNFFAREKNDRVPINYLYNPGINQKLMDHFNISTPLDLKRALNVDFCDSGVTYTGKPLFPSKEGHSVNPIDGTIRKYIKTEYGGYWECCDFLLEFAEEEEIAALPTPNLDDYNYEEATAIAKERSKEFSLCVGHPGMGCWINTNGFQRGMEQTFVDIATEDPAGILLAERRFNIELQTTERFLEKAGKYIDFMWIGEDLGTQHTPLISLDSYRKIIKPWHQKFIDLANVYNLPVMVHTCGSSSWVYEDFIEMGVTAVDTLQPEATNMNPQYLKDNFGGRLSFHGCISTAGPVAYGTPNEVEKNVKETLEIMKPNYEYAFAPTHQLQDNSPLENVLRMYDCALKYGSY